jgi:hypothetical protein
LRLFQENTHANKLLALLDARYCSWASLAMDPGDKIYALLGLTCFVELRIISQLQTNAYIGFYGYKDFGYVFLSTACLGFKQ